MLCHFGIILPTIIDVGQWGSFFFTQNIYYYAMLCWLKTGVVASPFPIFLGTTMDFIQNICRIGEIRGLAFVVVLDDFREPSTEGGFHPARMSWWGNVVDPQSHCSHWFEILLRIDHENAHQAISLAAVTVGHSWAFQKYLMARSQWMSAISKLSARKCPMILDGKNISQLVDFQPGWSAEASPTKSRAEPKVPSCRDEWQVEWQISQKLFQKECGKRISGIEANQIEW